MKQSSNQNDPQVRVLSKLITMTKHIRRNGTPAESIIAAQIEEDLIRKLSQGNRRELAKAA